MNSVLARIWNGLFRLTNIPAVIVFVVVAAAGVFAESQNREAFRRDLRADVLGDISLIRAKLEGNVKGNIELVRGLVSVLETEPDADQIQFAALARRLLAGDSQIRHLAAAPGLIVSMVYPVEGNEKAFGLDYRKNDAQRAAAFRVRDSGKIVVAGPVDLVQGGKALVGRFPVFTGQDHDRFWGIVSAVIDVERLYAASGLNDVADRLDVVISGKDGIRAAGLPFYGAETVLSQNPVVVDVNLPTGSWQVAAVPKGGWETVSPNPWPLRLLVFAAGALILVPTFSTGRLIEERQRHIGELRNREKLLARLSRRLGLALATSRVGVWEMDIDHNELFWDDRMNELYGYELDGGARGYEHWARRLHPDDLARAEEEFRLAVEERGHYDSEYRLRLPDGSVRHIRAIGVVYRDDGEPTRIVGVNWDVSSDILLTEDLKRANQLTEARNSELEATKARIEHNALHDSLTGLANRRYLDEILSESPGADGDGTDATALLHIDLDRFKQINDTLGHAAGDAILTHAASALADTVEAGDFVARVGGDEFVVLCRRPLRAGGALIEDLSRLAERIIARIQRPVVYEGHECRVGGSIGIAFTAEAGADPKKLLVNADIALYRAKSRGRNRYQFFNEALQAEIVTTKRVADEILTGIERGEFTPYYQPQFDADTLALIGVEALARWRHPREGMLTPDRFMKIAEELNVVDMIDRIILERTLADMKTWRDAELAVPKASVNVSARRLRDEDLVRSLRDLDIAPGTISFELVESIFLDEQDEVVAWNVDHIKELGIDVEIDDFGTGYASIVSLLKLKPSRLKIDRQFILPIVDDEQRRHLVGSIIDIGSSLGIEVLAEGVETMAHARMLRQIGCHALQGYAFARPMPADELADFVQARRWRAAS
ncbi:EAL domain-containing protein [Nitratireductor arenosus]|uniref:bifunctional diguanylate cyclase/phosphodiesterase n=1 Tax=Nitratireductor arenosus TaxID=2682096 RepID=UPI0012EA308D|nr:EAL domain-containing protein [Nitratireductor arenosus]